MSENRSEQATEQRKKKARQKGDRAQSRELSSSVALLAALLVLRPASAHFLAVWRGSYTGVLSLATQVHLPADEILRGISALGMTAFPPLLAVLCAALAGSVALGGAQSGGLQLTPAALAWKWSRVSPTEHAKQMLSVRSAVRLAKSLLPAGAVLLLGYRVLHGLLTTMPAMSHARLPETFAQSYGLSVKAAWIAVAWSGLDYAVERRNWNSRLRMTKQEIREEAKESNGNPHTKGRIRNIQRAMRRRRVKADVAQATVVITNPTHYAVALRFDTATMAAPRVLCKGRDLFAAEIREEARWAGVPLAENPPLARTLYRSVNEGQPIPFEQYAAVAAILAFLFRRDAAQAAQSSGYGNSASPYRPAVQILPPEPRAAQDGPV